ncbi:hypothetical protein [Variovorax sp. RCC_210]|uniref:hypothetical protein n=1 Tax=Variovorax sp. RCC_210 TaxID=3239217 RepID=UPI00352587A2
MTKAAPILFVAKLAATFFIALASTTSTSASSIGLSSDCNVRFADVHGNIDKKETSKNEGRFGLSRATQSPLPELIRTWHCVSSDDARVGSHGIATLQPYTGNWVLDWSRVIDSAGTRREQRWLYRWYSAKYQLVQLRSRNASGYAIVDGTQADSGGPPSEFDSHAKSNGPVVLSFCLLRPPRALCGEGLLGQKQDSSVNVFKSEALDLLRSIEFLD